MAAAHTEVRVMMRIMGRYGSVQSMHDTMGDELFSSAIVSTMDLFLK